MTEQNGNQSTIPNFVDADGSTWYVELDHQMIVDMKDTCGYDFDRLIQGDATANLATDPATLGAILWIVCERQADKRGTNTKDFSYALRGGILLGPAMDALNQAIVLFCRPVMRPAIQSLKDTETKSLQESTAAFQELVDSEETQQHIKTIVSRQVEAAKKALTTGRQSTTSPES